MVSAALAAARGDNTCISYACMIKTLHVREQPRTPYYLPHENDNAHSVHIIMWREGENNQREDSLWWVHSI